MTGVYISDCNWVVEDEVRDGVHNLPEWNQFLRFLDEYFIVDNGKSRVLTGGRYGCAQYSMQYHN
jgi:hypothetical protein